ncbi:potassium voltage-gated channel subfamily C member 3 isoform X1 [Hydra vulgaris]|uniref:potassium voltage-gated channel subfamily C member 3 isoform X1 n=1 Tax=Hydra vulgaris TaxID=6087 RepID=UPI001F5EB712|nr:potassium voltage-gated channel subfamily C member 3 [Hydra vulgaris]
MSVELSCLRNSFEKHEEKTANDRIVINVGGMRHECYISTILNIHDSRLKWIAETALRTSDFNPDVHEFFFDRHPGCFTHILNYCRTGQLHFPNDVCGPLFEQELTFWGIDENLIEPCCYSNYIQYREAKDYISMFDALDNVEEFPNEKLINKINQYKSSWIYCLLKAKINLWCLVENSFDSLYSQIVAVISVSVVMISILTFCLSTMSYFNDQKKIFSILDYIYCCYFTIELLVRLTCCPSYIKIFKSVQTYIDIVTTLQFYIEFIFNSSSVGFLQAFKLLRMLRLYRFVKNINGMRIITQTLKASVKELMLLLAIFLLPMIIFSTLLYYSEKAFADEKDCRSIPENFWWAIVTMTTLGYGDIVPQSGLGKLVGAICALSGILILALPVSVVGRNFTIFYAYAQARLRLPQTKKAALSNVDRKLLNQQTNNASCRDNSLSTKDISNGSSPIIRWVSPQQNYGRRPAINTNMSFEINKQKSSLNLRTSII